MQNWVVLCQLLTYYFRISAIFPIIKQSTLPLDHVPYAHCPLRQSDLDSDNIALIKIIDLPASALQWNFFYTWESYVDHDGHTNFVQAGLLHQVSGKGSAGHL